MVSVTIHFNSNRLNVVAPGGLSHATLVLNDGKTKSGQLGCPQLIAKLSDYFSHLSFALMVSPALYSCNVSFDALNSCTVPLVSRSVIFS